MAFSEHNISDMTNKNDLTRKTLITRMTSKLEDWQKEKINSFSHKLSPHFSL